MTITAAHESMAPIATISPTMIQIEKGRGGGVLGSSRAGDIEGKATEDEQGVHHYHGKYFLRQSMTVSLGARVQKLLQGKIMKPQSLAGAK